MRNIYHVHTPENVTLEFELAGVGSRGAAVIIDTFIQNIVLLAVIIALALISGDASMNFMTVENNTLYIVAGLLLMFILQFGYFSLFEYFMKGTTPGKKIVGLKVMMSNGEPISLAASLIRNFTRIGDMLPGIYGVGIISVVLTRKYMRVGDMAANTVVVKEKGRKGDFAEIAKSSSEHRNLVISPKEEALLKEYQERKRNPKNPLNSYILEAQLYHHFYNKVGLVPNLPDRFSKRVYLEKLFEYLNI